MEFKSGFKPTACRSSDIRSIQSHRDYSSTNYDGVLAVFPLFTNTP